MQRADGNRMLRYCVRGGPYHKGATAVDCVRRTANDTRRAQWVSSPAKILPLIATEYICVWRGFESGSSRLPEFTGNAKLWAMVSASPSANPSVTQVFALDAALDLGGRLPFVV